MSGGVFGQSGHAQLCASRDLACVLKHALQIAEHSDDGSHIGPLRTVLGRVRARAQELGLGQSANAKQKAQDVVLFRYVGQLLRYCQHDDPILPAKVLQQLASDAEADFQTTPAYLDKQIEYSRGGCASTGHVGKDDATTKLVLDVLRRYLDVAARMSESARRQHGVSLYPDFGALLPHLHRRHLHSAPTAVWQVAQRWLEAALIKAKDMLPDLTDEELRAVFDAECGRCAFVGADGLHTERTTMRGGNPLPPLATVWYELVRAAFLFISRPCCEGCEDFMAGDDNIDVIALVAFGNVQDSRPERRGRPAMHLLSWHGGVRRELVEGSGWVATPAPAPPSARKQAAGSSGPQKRRRPRASGSSSRPPRRKRRAIGRDEPSDEEDVEAEAAASEGEAGDDEDDEDEDEWEEDDDASDGWEEGLQGDYLAGGSEEPPRTTPRDRRKRRCGCHGDECDACDILSVSGDEQLIEQALLQEAEQLRRLVKEAAAAAGVRAGSLFLVSSVGASVQWVCGGDGVWMRQIPRFNAAAAAWLRSPEVVEALAARGREQEVHAAHVQEAVLLRPRIERAMEVLGLTQQQLGEALELAPTVVFASRDVSRWLLVTPDDSAWHVSTSLAEINGAMRVWAEQREDDVKEALKLDTPSCLRVRLSTAQARSMRTSQSDKAEEMRAAQADKLEDQIEAAIERVRTGVAPSMTEAHIRGMNVGLKKMELRQRGIQVDSAANGPRCIEMLIRVACFEGAPPTSTHAEQEGSPSGGAVGGAPDGRVGG